MADALSDEPSRVESATLFKLHSPVGSQLECNGAADDYADGFR